MSADTGSPADVIASARAVAAASTDAQPWDNIGTYSPAHHRAFAKSHMGTSLAELTDDDLIALTEDRNFIDFVNQERARRARERAKLAAPKPATATTAPSTGGITRANVDAQIAHMRSELAEKGKTELSYLLRNDGVLADLFRHYVDHLDETMRLRDVIIFLAPHLEFARAMNERNIQRNERLDALEARIDELEKIPRFEDQGVWGAERAYRPGDGVSFDGHYWLCRHETTAGQRPDLNHDSWRLAVRRGKQGAPGRDARS